MAVKALRPLPGDPVEVRRTPRCEADTSNQNEFNARWRQDRYPSEGSIYRCSRPSMVELDGKKLCRLHAGHACLAMYLRGDLVEAPK